MSIFRPKEPSNEMQTQGVALDLARKTFLDLIYAWNSPNGYTSNGLEPLIFAFGRASGTPTTPEAMMAKYDLKKHNYKQLLTRPWEWTLAAAQQASAEGDHELVVIAAFWAGQWRMMIQPRLSPYEQAFWLVGNIQPHVGTALADLAEDSLQYLPPEHVVFGNETGQVSVAFLRSGIRKMLC